MIICDKQQSFYGPVFWVFELIKKSYGLDLIATDSKKITVGDNDKSDIRVAGAFYKDLLQYKKYEFEHYFHDTPLIRLDNGLPDYLSTVFYLVNGFQEYNLPKSKQDKYGRMDYEYSLQYKYKVLHENLVEKYIQELLFQIDGSFFLPQKKSRIFLSHDIDSVFGSLKYDGLWAIKTGNIKAMLNLITQTVRSNPPWFNMDKIANLEDDHDVKACYYWIVQNGRSADGIKNGDYNILSNKIQTQLKYVALKGNEVGMHKSTMPTSFEAELSRLKGIDSNRFHFLKINNPESYRHIEAAGMKSDSSIGFPYEMGFKNSFGLPYHPYDIERKQQCNVLEIPLHIMDGMFDIKDKHTSEEAFTKITEFIEANKYNSVLSILWHNSEMTNFAYKWSFDCYKRILKYIVTHDFETVLPSQLVKAYETV